MRRLKYLAAVAAVSRVNTFVLYNERQVWWGGGVAAVVVVEAFSEHHANTE